MYRLEDIVIESSDYVINSAAVQALTAFKDLNTWRSANRHLRHPGMQNLINSLIEAYDLHVMISVTDGCNEVNTPVDEGVSAYVIELSSGRLSIISLLNGFFRIVQIVNHEPDDFISRQRDAVMLYRHVYLQQFERLQFHPDSGGFSLPGRSLGFKARIELTNPNVSEEEVAVPRARVQAYAETAPVDVAVPRARINCPIIPESVLASTSARPGTSAQPCTSTSELSEECVDDRDDSYYENESPER